MFIVNRFKNKMGQYSIYLHTYSNLFISMGRFDSLKENTSSSSNSRENNNRMNNQENNGETSRRNNRPYTRLSTTRRIPVRPIPVKPINMNSNKEEDFPELVKKKGEEEGKEENTDPNTDPNIPNKSSWQNAMKQREEEEERIKEGTINQYDPKYWRGASWIGPMLIHQKKYPDSWYKYMESAVKGHASSYLFPFRETEYSRDGENWYSSWNDTFSEVQLQRMEYEEEEERKMEQYRVLEEYRDRLGEESDKYYEETGELDGYAIAYLERIEYEKYAEQFDDITPLEEFGDDMDSDDYLEDDN